MPFSSKRHADLAKDLDILLGDLCTLGGYCNNLAGAAILKSQPGKLSARNFALLVLRAEGMDPDPHSDYAKYVSDAFHRRYGDEVDVATWRTLNTQ